MSDVDFDCPFCHELLGVPPELVGQKVKCPSCSKIITVTDPKTARETSKKTFKVNRSESESNTPSRPPQQYQQGNGNSSQTPLILILVLLLIGVILAGLSFFHIKPRTQFEYKQISFLAGNNDRTGVGALKYASIKYEQSVLDKMGIEGWEMVGCYLEMETAFPNFGRDDLVTGIQPNIRPQCLVLIFKRQVR